MGEVKEESAARPGRNTAVDRRVKGRVVVHLELAIEFEAPGAVQRGPPEPIEAAGEVCALFGKDGQTLPVAFGVTRRTVGAFGLLAGVVDFQREDGEPVDDKAGRLG